MQLICQFGTDETEQQCEDAMCPQILDSLGMDATSFLIQPACALVCET